MTPFAACWCHCELWQENTQESHDVPLTWRIWWLIGSHQKDADSAANLVLGSDGRFCHWPARLMMCMICVLSIYVNIRDIVLGPLTCDVFVTGSEMYEWEREMILHQLLALLLPVCLLLQATSSWIWSHVDVDDINSAAWLRNQSTFWAFKVQLVFTHNSVLKRVGMKGGLQK